MATNLRSSVTSYVMFKPICNAAMPADALHSAITTPMIRAVSDAAEERDVAELTAPVNTPDAPGGSAVFNPLTRSLDRAGAEAQQAGDAEYRDQRRKERQEPVVGQASRGHAAPVARELLHAALESLPPSDLAEFERVSGPRRLLSSCAGMVSRDCCGSGMNPRYPIAP